MQNWSLSCKLCPEKFPQIIGHFYQSIFGDICLQNSCEILVKSTSFFLQICFWKSRESRLFSRNLSEALHKTLMNDKSRGKQVDMSTSWNKALHSPKMKSIVFSQNKNTLCFNQSYNAIQQYFACMLFHKFVGKLWKYNCLNFKVWDGISVTM